MTISVLAPPGFRRDVDVNLFDANVSLLKFVSPLSYLIIERLERESPGKSPSPSTPYHLGPLLIITTLTMPCRGVIYVHE